MRRMTIAISEDVYEKILKLSDMYGSFSEVVRTAVAKLFEAKFAENSFEKTVLNMLKVLKEDAEKMKKFLGVKE